MATWSNGPGPTAGDDIYQGDDDPNRAGGRRGGDTLIGGGDNDLLRGGLGADSLAGGAGADTLRGGLGTDTLDGGAGGDTLDGGQGADVYLVKSSDGVDEFRDSGITGFDRVVVTSIDVFYLRSGFGPNNGIEEIQSGETMSGPGGDVIFSGPSSIFGGDGTGPTIFSGADVVLNFSATRLINVSAVFGGLGSDKITAPDAGMRIFGVGGADTLIGGGGSDYLLGEADADVLRGGGGADTLSGGSGVDTLEGGAGADVFLFDSFPDGDVIRGFSSTDDTIHLDGDIFRVLRTGAAHTLDASQFRVGAAAADADDHIIYDRSTGELKYDVDGNGTGVALTFVKLSGSPLLSAQDFLVVF